MAGLTKQHFKEIANIININRNIAYGYIVTSDLVEKLSQYFKTQNPQFNEAQFKEACLN